MDKKGLIEWSNNNNPRKIIYAQDRVSKKIQDIWEFKDPQYPTEKSLDLLKRIISASSAKDGIVLDFFCGSGTTLIASENLSRRWIGIDQSPKAIETVKKRINETTNTYSRKIDYLIL